VGIRDRDGAFADYLTLPASNLHAIPASIDDRTAVFIEPLAAACRVVEQVSIAPGANAAVVGAGRLGLLVAQVLREHGARVTVFGRGERGIATARALGFDTAQATDRALARRYALVVDATGNPDGFATAARLVQPRGSIVLKSTFHGETPVAWSPLVVDEIAVIGSRCGPFARAIDLLAAGRIEVKALVEGVYRLEQFADAFEHARRGFKVIFEPALG
jgi:alcohol dehydrogenase